MLHEAYYIRVLQGRQTCQVVTVTVSAARTGDPDQLLCIPSPNAKMDYLVVRLSPSTTTTDFFIIARSVGSSCAERGV